MKYSHFSSDPIEKVYDRSQDNNWHKPHGLWISVDGADDWPEWCTAEDFIDMDKQYHYDVLLHKNANILHLQNADEIRAFHRQWREEKPRIPKLDRYQIDWPKLANHYQGIIIAPYCWSMRLDMEVDWYYGWDCASGCIWDSSAIQSIDLIREPIKEAA